MSSLYFAAAAALLATVFLSIVLRPLARALDFVDRPGGRKMHSGEIPVVGGLAMFVGLGLGLAALPEGARVPVGFLVTAFVFVCLGILDDRYGLSPALRLAIQVVAVVAMALIGALAVHYIGEPFGTGRTIFVLPAAIVVTVMLVVGAVNALNMVDGIDGLAGSLGLVALVAVSTVALQSANATVLSLSVVLGAALVGFLAFNLPLGINQRWRVFMGDAGSMLLGFTLAWMMVSLSQDPQTVVAPVTLLWFGAVPIYDMVSTALSRLMDGRSPMSADTNHLHHRLLRKGYSPEATLSILVSFAVLWSVAGFALETLTEWPEWMSLVGFLIAGVVTVFAVRAYPSKRGMAG